MRRATPRARAVETFDPAIWSIAMALSAAIVYLAWVS